MSRIVLPSETIIEHRQSHRGPKQPPACRVLVILGLLVIGDCIGPAGAQTFSDANKVKLQDLCDRGIITGSICTAIQNGGVVQGSASQTLSPNAVIAQQQLIKARTAEKRKQVTGASPDAVSAEFGNGFSTFLTAGATSLRHHENSFEEGYDSIIPSVTVGGDYRVNDKLLTGIALNYHNWNGSFDDGGGFDLHSYGPLLYMNYRPYDRTFANAVLGYARQDISRSRQAAIIVPTPNANLSVLPGATQGDLNSNQFSANFLAGHDYEMENFIIGPRIGLDVLHWQTDDYSEQGTTDLKLRYRDLDQTSVQSSLGMKASFVVDTRIGFVAPYLASSWVHEFANNDRTIHATFVSDSTASEFDFERENPARNWAVVDTGATLFLSRSLQGFVNFTTVQGNRNFVSYGGNVGVRINW